MLVSSLSIIFADRRHVIGYSVPEAMDYLREIIFALEFVTNVARPNIESDSGFSQ